MPLTPPKFLLGSDQDLSLESSLADLRLYYFQVDVNFKGKDLAPLFESHPDLPGAILQEEGQFLGMISRKRFLEYLLRPHGVKLFLEEPLRVLYSYARTDLLVLPGDTSVLVAARLGLARSRTLAGEPIVVTMPDHSYYLLDWHELNTAAWQIRGIETQVRYERNQVQMIQTEKMANLGRLVNGVAHEILDPVGFIWGNLSHLSNYHDSLLELLEAYEAEHSEIPPAIQDLKDELEFDYLTADLPKAFDSITAGAKRLKKLVSALQNFCHIDEVHPKPADLHSCLDGIILLLKTRLKSEIEIVRNYGDLPPISCYIGQLSQVFTNIITNAADALVLKAVSQEYNRTIKRSQPNPTVLKPRLTITTQILSPDASDQASFQERWVMIVIADNGLGLTPETKASILESFSVEKRTAKETSLAISYQIVTARHGGKIRLESRSLAEGYSPEETGTEFQIFLPLV